jgi:hypothetical protein
VRTIYALFDDFDVAWQVGRTCWGAGLQMTDINVIVPENRSQAMGARAEVPRLVTADMPGSLILRNR